MHMILHKVLIPLLLNSSVFAMQRVKKKLKPTPLAERLEEQLTYQNQYPDQLTTPGMKAATKGDINTIRLLLGHVNLNTENAASESLLTKAAQEDHLNIVQELLATGRINLQSQGSILALLAAVQNGNPYIVRALVHAGVPVNGQDSTNGYSPLMMAVFKNNSYMVSLLLSHGAIDVTIENNDGYTAWSLAVKLKYWELAQAITTRRMQLMNNAN